MAKPQSATVPVAFIVLGAILLFVIPALGVVLILVGGILLVVRVVAGTANTITDQTKACPFCAEKIKVDAKVCRFCGRGLITSTPAAASEKASSPQIPDDYRKLMEQLGITFDGQRYYYEQYRYEKLEDAVNYAIRTQNRG